MSGIADLSVAREAANSPPELRRTRVLFVTLVLALTFLTYLGTLWFQFVEDDQYLILDNPFLRSWRYLPRYFQTDLWNFLHPSLPGSYYRPLYLLWLRLNYAVFGTSPWGWHLTTLLAHVGATLLVYRLARRYLDDWVTALFAALIFGLHPVHIEGAAWISGVSEPLLALLMIPSYLCYLRSVSSGPESGAGDAARHRREWLATSLALYGLALLTKETAVVLPMLIFASQWIGLGVDSLREGKLWLHRFAASFRSAFPYLVLTVPYLVVRYFALGSFAPPAVPLSPLVVLWTWPSLLWLYLKHLIWPAGLSAFYDLSYVVRPDFYKVVVPSIPVLLAGVMLAWGARRSQRVALASIWLLLPLLPVLDVRVFGDGNFAHDRYLYLPSVGFSLLAALLLRRVSVGRARLLGQPAAQVGLALVLACAMGLSATSQSAYLANRISYFTHSYAGAPNNEMAMSNLAGLLGEQGHYAEAEKIYRGILERNPDSGFISYDLGHTYYLMGRLQEAEYYLARATQSMPSWPQGYFNLGMTQLRMGHLEDASLNLRRALAISPYSDDYHYALGIVLKMQGNLEGALAEFRAELALNPGHAGARQQAAEIGKALSRGRAPSSAATPRP